MKRVNFGNTSLDWIKATLGVAVALTVLVASRSVVLCDPVVLSTRTVGATNAVNISVTLDHQRPTLSVTSLTDIADWALKMSATSLSGNFSSDITDITWKVFPMLKFKVDTGADGILADFYVYTNYANEPQYKALISTPNMDKYMKRGVSGGLLDASLYSELAAKNVTPDAALIPMRACVALTDTENASESNLPTDNYRWQWIPDVSVTSDAYLTQPVASVVDLLQRPTFNVYVRFSSAQKSQVGMQYSTTLYFRLIGQ